MELNNVMISWLGHASFQIIDKISRKIIYIDPFQLKDVKGGADYILNTHSHYDHCSLEDMKKVAKPETVVFTVPDAQSKISGLKCAKVVLVEPGKKYEMSGIRMITVPAYNIGKHFHAKENAWVGYVIEINGLKIYHAGDTDFIPEMSSLKGKIDIAMLPIGGTYTMNADDAAKAVAVISPKIAIPMHYGSIVGGNADLQRFIELCNKNSPNVKVITQT